MEMTIMLIGILAVVAVCSAGYSRHFSDYLFLLCAFLPLDFGKGVGRKNLINPVILNAHS